MNKDNYPKLRKALEAIKSGEVKPKVVLIGDSFLHLHCDPRVTASDIHKYKVNLRKGKKWVIKKNAKQIDGKIFSFVEGWKIDRGIYKGDMAMIPADNNYPLDAPGWIALKDLELVSITHFDEPIEVE